jgi:hypothetical protein
MICQIFINKWLLSLFVFAGSLLFTASLAASNATEPGSSLQRLQLQSTATACEISLGKLTQANWRGERTITYKANNEQMHLCLFASELAVTNCDEMKSCPTYQDWSARSTDFNPKMPKEVFWQKYEERINVLKSFASNKTN